MALRKAAAASAAIHPVPSRGHANCLKCGLFASGCRTPFMQGHGPIGGIAIVGEAPGKQEDDQGKAFVGATGKMMRKELAARGIDPSLCFWSNAARCRPPDNKIKPGHITQCRPFLEHELRTVAPKLILLVGNQALVSVLKRGGILKQRRTAFTYSYRRAGSAEMVNVPCIACLHPAYIMRQRDMRPEFEGDLDFFVDTARSLGLVSAADATKKSKTIIDLTATVDVNMYPTLEQVQAFAHDVRKHNRVIGYDTETDTLRPYVETDFALLCMGMSTGKQTIVVQCDVPVTLDVTAPVLRYGADSDSRDTQVKLAVMLDLLTDPAIRKVAHSSKYDYHVINVRFGKRVRNMWIDTRVLHSFLYSIEGMAHDLDTVVASLLNVWKYKHVTHEWVGEGEANPKKFKTVPYEQLALRNGLDCYGCLSTVRPMLRELAKYTRVWERIARVKRTSPEEVFHKLIMPTLQSLVEMEERGIQVDLDYVKKFRAELAADIQRTSRSMLRMPAVRAYEGARRAEVLAAAQEQKRYPRPEVIRNRLAKVKFNANSRDQVADILMTHCRLRDMGAPLQYTDTKKVSMSEEALASYSAFASNQGAVDTVAFIDDAQAYAAAIKGQGTFIDGMMNYVDARGRVHTSYNMDVTRTGRLSSSDPNLQNIPIRGKGGVDDPRYRRMYIARPGYKLVSGDYSQVELRVLAAFGRDRVMIDIFKSGRDLHTETARLAFGISVKDEVSKYQRRAAKTVNFGVVYGQTPKGLAAQLGCTESEAEVLLNTILRQFRGAAQWMAMEKAFARKHGVVFTWFGRPRPLGNATLDGNDGGLVSAAERRAVNTPVQGTANEICLIAFQAASKYFARQAYECSPVAIVHDQILFECEDNAVSAASTAIRRICIDAPIRALGPEFIVPLVLDLSVGQTWGDLEDIK